MGTVGRALRNPEVVNADGSAGRMYNDAESEAGFELEL